MVCRFSRLWWVFVLLVCAATDSRAQCSSNTTAFGNIGTEPGKPFSAERVTISGHPDGEQTVPTQFVFVEFIARDSSGRVRIERLLEPVNPTASKVAISAVRRSIIICDAATGTFTTMDTLNRTFDRVEGSAPRFVNRPRRPYGSAFFPTSATRMPPNSQFEDLGHATKEGIEVHGGRLTDPARIGERWLSDELSAHVLEIYTDPKSGSFTRIALTRVSRAEPDPSLFEIPAGYTRTNTPR